MSRETVVLGQNEIRAILPHRYPFLLVDRILEIDYEKPSILGLKNVTANEYFFEGHFPENPIMPGVLILEALAQAGGILAHQKCASDRIALLLTINQAKFRSPVYPGDTLYLYAEGKMLGSKGGKIQTRAYVGEKTAVEAEIGFVFLDKKEFFEQGN